MSDRQQFVIAETRVFVVSAQTAAEALELYRDKSADVVSDEIAAPAVTVIER